jgi:proteasome lid subunit RPN8/RPN11
MTPALLETILQHARRENPRESCGLLIAEGTDSLASYVPCRNLLTGDFFNLHPEDWAAAEDRGRILGVVHSHPGGEAKPSGADLQAQLSTGLPWWIVVPETGAWARFGAAQLTGRTFAWGVSDCYTLAADWFQGVPDFVREPDFWKTRDLFRGGLERAGFREVHDGPRPGDALLFAIRSGVPNHCAVYMGDGRILHHLPGRLSCQELMGRWVRDVVAVVRRAA